MNYPINRSAAPFLTFLFSMLPGAGHMYLGLMRRGFEIMFAFFASIFIIAGTLRLSEIGIPLTIIIFFYALFDAMHLYKAIGRGEEMIDEHFIKISNRGINGYHIGIGMMALGFLFLLDRLQAAVFRFIPAHLYNSLRGSVAPLIIIGIGLFMMVKATRSDAVARKTE